MQILKLKDVIFKHQIDEFNTTSHMTATEEKGRQWKELRTSQSALVVMQYIIIMQWWIDQDLHLTSKE